MIEILTSGSRYFKVLYANDKVSSIMHFLYNSFVLFSKAWSVTSGVSKISKKAHIR